MGAGASASREEHWGVSLKHLSSLSIPAGGMFADARDLITEKTRKLKGGDRSYAALLKSKPDTKDLVKDTADYFVTFAWNVEFKATMAALEERFGDEDVFLWMDFACVDQFKEADQAARGIATSKRHKVLLTHLEAIGKAVVVLAPIGEPAALSRAWCVFEVINMVEKGTPFEFVAKDQHVVEMMKRGEMTLAWYLKVLGKVDAEASQAYRRKEMDAIHKWLKKHGTDKVNGEIKSRVTTWLKGLADRAAGECAPASVELRNVLIAQAKLFTGIGEVEKSHEYYQKAIDDSKALPDESQRLFYLAKSLNTFAKVLKYEKQKEKAEPLFRESLELRKKMHEAEDPTHPFLAIGQHNLGEFLMEEGQFAEAAELFQKALESRRAMFGSLHPTVPQGLRNLGMVFEKSGNAREAEMHFREAHEIDVQLFSPTHLLAGRDLQRVAVALKAQGKEEEAKKLGREAVDVLTKNLGRQNPEVVEASKEWA